MNYVFSFFFLSAILAAIFQFVFLGNTDVFSDLVSSLFSAAEKSVGIAIYLIGIMSLWLGILKIGEDAGAIEKLSKGVSPFFSKIFPDIPKNHPAQGTVLMNIAANMLGLDNAATPLGIKAMKDLQSLNGNSETASNSMIMFLVLNTSGLTLIPVSVIALRAAAQAANPADVFLPILLATSVATLVGLIAVGIYQKINLLQPMFLMVAAAFIAVFAILFYFITGENNLAKESVGHIGNFIILLLIALFIVLGLLKKINIYNSFIDGATQGFKVAIDIIPYLVAMLVAIGIFRASGLFDIILLGLEKAVLAFGLNADFIPAMPTALMKPLSGSGARGMMIEAMDTYGVDSFVGKLAATFQGSTETTFYTLAVYYGAVKIKNIRYTLTCGLLADFAGIIAAICIAYLLF